jgi:hypothetical protein
MMIFFFAAFLKRGSVRIISSLHFFHPIFVSLQLLENLIVLIAYNEI